MLQGFLPNACFNRKLTLGSVKIDQNNIRLKTTVLTEVMHTSLFWNEIRFVLILHPFPTIIVDNLDPHVEEKALDRAMERLLLGLREEFG